MVVEALNAVYSKNKKAFIPELGVILLSEHTEEAFFNKHLTFDDGKLIEEIMKSRQIDEDTARKALADFIISVKNSTENHGCFALGNIGFFSLNEQDELIIVQTDQPVSNGFTTTTNSVSVNTDSPEPTFEINYQSERAIPYIQPTMRLEQEEELVQAYYHRKAKYGLKKAFRPPLALVFIAILGVMALSVYLFKMHKKQEFAATKNWVYVKYNKVINYMSSLAEVFQNISSNERPKTPPASENLIVNAAFSYTPEESDQMRANNQPVVQTDHLESERYRIIIGSFKNETNADNFIEYLKSQKIEVAKIEDKHFYLVGIDAVQGKTKALSLLNEIREKHEPSAWMNKID